MRQRCHLSYVTRASNWYRLTAGQGLLSLQQVWVEWECFHFFCVFTFIHFPLSPLSLSHLLIYLFCLSSPFLWELRGWLGCAKVLCLLCHRGVQLILAYILTRPAIRVAGKGRGGMFLFLLFFTFIPVRLSSLFLSFISSTISSISFLPSYGRWYKMTHKGCCVIKHQHNTINQNSLWDSTKWPTRVDKSRVVKPQHNQSIKMFTYNNYIFNIHLYIILDINAYHAVCRFSRH